MFNSNRETVDRIIGTEQKIVFVTNLNLGIVNLRNIVL